jgi:DNA polymerase-4
MRWLYVDFDSYFASCEQLDRPELRGKPIAIVPVIADTTCAIAASYEAKAYGVKTGTRIWQARKMCPGLILVPARHDLYVALHARLKNAIEACHPVTAVCSIDEIACRLGARDRAPSEALKLAAEIKAALGTRIGPALRCSVGIASNRFLAKIAADLDKPNGLTLLLPEDLPGRLFDLKITDLTGIARAMETRLHRAGVQSVSDLWNRTLPQMKAIWGGIEGVRFWYKLHGYDLPQAETERATIGHSRVLAPELRSPLAARDVAKRLLLKAVSRLRRLGYCAAGLSLDVRFADRSHWDARRRTQPSDDDFVFLPMLEILWQSLLRGAENRPLLKVGVHLYDLVEARQTTMDLFASASGKRDTAKLSRAIDSIHRRFGRSSLTIGWEPAPIADLGTKIAFTRVPDMTEFNE